ncbi:putative E3 ubiquitin-protein ligase [Ophidiomyces ophidiicola]|nr:putative E3 ubiquitin-protein ligase [Ophidiomyces ophidiicola]
MASRASGAGAAPETVSEAGCDNDDDDALLAHQHHQHHHAHDHHNHHRTVAAAELARPPPMARRSHSRSLSNPFPALFRSKRAVSASRDPFPDGGSTSTCSDDDNDINNNDAAPPLARSASPARRRRAASSSRPPPPPPADSRAVRRCCTCGHANAFVAGRKGFRCAKCTTMNDLAPAYPSLRPQGPACESVSPDVCISVEKTRRIIESCMLSFLHAQLDVLEPRPPLGRRRGVSESHLSSYSGPRAASNGAIRPLAASQPHHHPTNDDDPARTARQGTIPQPGSIPGAIKRKPLPSTAAVPSFSYAPQRPGQATDDARQSSRPQGRVFRALEEYLYTSLDGCDMLNNSFLAIGSRHPRAASEGSPIRKADVHCSQAPTSLQLDGKSFPLANIAENGNECSGNRPVRHKSTNGHQNPKPSTSQTGFVSSKSPHINWSELAEWYYLILHAGDSWNALWQRMKPAEPDALPKWEAVSLSRLEEMFSESQFRLRMVLLRATEKLLLRPRRPLERPEDTRFLLIILANPLLYPGSYSSWKLPRKLLVPPRANDSMVNGNSTAPTSEPSSSQKYSGINFNKVVESSDRRFVVMKRTIGLLSNLSSECHHLLISWFSRLSETHFRQLVDLIGSFVTYRLNRGKKRRPSKSQTLGENIEELVPTFSSANTVMPAQLHSALQRDNPSSKPPKTDHTTVVYSDDWQLKAAARVMSLLFQANTSTQRRRPEQQLSPDSSPNATHAMIPISTFYNMLLDYSDLIADFETWESRSGKFTFCQYSFFLSIWAKISILEHDARRQMEAKAREVFFDNILGRRGGSQYLVLKIRRECLVEDSLSRVSEVIGSSAGDIKKGLRIEFVGEEGVDAGGLRKEWFLLLVREVFDPLHGKVSSPYSNVRCRSANHQLAGLFLYDEDSQYCYFNPHCFESSEQFFLVGVVLGLAIYNSTILDVALPPFAYRKLLASARVADVPTLSIPSQPFRCTLEDLAEYRPALARGLRQLLEYDGDVEETFCRDFVVQVERYGETVEVPLCPGGEKRPVTNSNRREFVDLYVKYVLNKAVSRQFEPFKRGFFTICGGNALHLFRPEEIELLVRGSDQALDISSLRAVAKYDNWQVANPEKEPVVKWFWDFFSRISPRDQRKVLGFITGSDRIPAMGETSLGIRILCLGQDSERFPIARTCFNMLSLYRYRTRQKFESKLWRAVVESEGFGLK